MMAEMPFFSKGASLRRFARAGSTLPVPTATASQASHHTIARMIKYGALPGSAVVVLALSAPGFSLGIGDVLDRTRASGAAVGAHETTKREMVGPTASPARRMTVSIRSRLPRSDRAPIEFGASTSAFSMAPAVQPFSIESQPALMIAPLDLDIELRTVDLVTRNVAHTVEAVLGHASDPTSMASDFAGVALRPPVAGRETVVRAAPVEALTPPQPVLFMPDLAEFAPVAVSSRSVAAPILPPADPFPVPREDPIALPFDPLAAVELAPISRTRVATDVGLATGPVEALRTSAALASPIVQTIDLLPVNNAAGAQPVSVSDRQPVMSQSSPVVAPAQPVQMAAIPAPRQTPGLAHAAAQQVVFPALPSIGTEPEPADTVEYAAIVDPVRPATLPPSANSSPFGPDISTRMLTRIDGQLAGKLDFQQTNQTLSVRIGSIVELLKDRYDANAFARIASSSASNTFLPIRQLREAGIPITYDPVYDEFNVGSRDHRPASAHKVQIDQISTPEYAPGPAGMDQIPR